MKSPPSDYYFRLETMRPILALVTDRIFQSQRLQVAMHCAHRVAHTGVAESSSQEIRLAVQALRHWAAGSPTLGRPERNPPEAKPLEASPWAAKAAPGTMTPPNPLGAFGGGPSGVGRRTTAAAGLGGAG